MDVHLDGERLVGADYEHATILDCRFVGCDLSASVLREAVLHRVEFRSCRLSAANFSGAKLRDVRFVECKLDDANFRMAVGEKVGFDDCVLTASDFYAASLPGAVLARCELTGAEFSKCQLLGADLRGSRIDAIKGAIDLSGVIIDSAQIIPLALSMFAALSVTIDDEPASS